MTQENKKGPFALEIPTLLSGESVIGHPSYESTLVSRSMFDFGVIDLWTLFESYE